MSVRVRMAPSPTGFLHIGGVRTFLFNWLFARQHRGEILLRIENTDTSREVAESVEQIQSSLRWLGLDWDGEVRFQLDAMERCGEVAQRLVEEGKAYVDEGAIRFRMPDDGTTAWDDAVRGRVEVLNETIMEDRITHVIRGDDHISNTPKQIQILSALGAEIPVYAHAPSLLGADGKKLSKRHGAQSIEELRDMGYVAPALFNFLALLGWSYDDKTTIMSREELIERFSLERVVPSPATFDYEKLDWMNGVYLRGMSPEEYADALVAYLGPEWDEETVRKAAPLVQEKIERLDRFADFAGFLFHDVEPDPEQLDPKLLAAAREALEEVDPWTAEAIEAALRGLAERLDLSPRKAFQPIRVAVTGSTVSPGLFESLEVLGRDESLRRVSRATVAAGA